MTTYRIVKMKFISPLHLARGIGGAYDTAEDKLRSDTISGAIASMYAITNPEADVLSFMESYKVSSGFPFIGNCLFLPKPAGYRGLSIQGKDYSQQRKILKGIQYLQLDRWQKAIVGEKLEVTEDTISKEGLLYDLPVEKDQENKPIRLFVSELQQKVWIARQGGDPIDKGAEVDIAEKSDASEPYYFDRTYFHKNAGLYFLVDANEKVFQQILTLMGHLGLTGFGSDKSVGNGQFEVEKGEIDFKSQSVSNKLILLSATVPLKEEAVDGSLLQSSYQLVKRGGYMAGTSVDAFRHLRKKSVYMLTEGSLIHRSIMKGKIVDVTPDWNDSLMHRVYRDGRALYVNANL